MEISQNDDHSLQTDHNNEVSSGSTECHLGNQVLTLVSSNGNQFVVMSSESDSLNLSESGVLQQGDHSVALSLDETTRYLLQNSTVANAVMLPDGTYHILDQPLVQVEREDGTIETQTFNIEVLRALQDNLDQQMPGMDTCYSLEGMDSMDETSSSSVIKSEAQLDSTADEPTNEDSNDRLDIPANDAQHATQASEPDKTTDDSSESATNTEGGRKKRLVKEKVAIKKEQETKEPDLNSPIPLSDQTVITVKGKKCVLAFNQATQQVCAYPLKPPPGTKKRGRPRLSEEEKTERKKQLTNIEAKAPDLPANTKENSSVAETLLELSNIGQDGIRRSNRKRKKAKLFEEYEELDDSEEDIKPSFEDSEEKDPDITLELPEAKKKKLQVPKDEVAVTSTIILASSAAQPVKKRGRGRPRRYPPPSQQQQAHTSIPAVMIPSGNFQTLVMAPLQNFQRQLPNLVPKPLTDANGQVTAEGSDQTNLLLTSDSETSPLDSPSVALDGNNIIPKALQGDTVPIVGDPESAETLDQLSVLNFMASTTTSDKPKDGLTVETGITSSQVKVIQIPNNLLASLGIKKDPIKIGLKATEKELEKLKCPKCDFQGFYIQQYRSHLATHGDDIHKCKCCAYVCLDSERLLDHFKEFHPRCICPECDFMAEHAYIIKRHMMRHDTKSCTCNVCGKVYKDMYILKMHVKMVHMPAEVLFECDVCSKKFTRKAHLKRHLRIHDPEKPYKCSVCDYRGCERSDISKHMLIHQEPKHACERCGKTFRHIKNKELHVKRHYGQRDYKCGVCDFFGYTFTDIRKHIERKHHEMKTLICDKCNKTFKNEAALKEHQQTTCNSLMIIEQVLAIPTSEGGTTQATIQIPSSLNQDGQLMIDGQTISLDGRGITVQKNSVIMVTGEQQGLIMTEGTMEEEEEEMDDVEGGLTQAMQIMGETIMSHSGEEMHIISKDSLHDPSLQAHILDHNGQLLRADDLHMVAPNGQIFYKTTPGVLGHDLMDEAKHTMDQNGHLVQQVAELDSEIDHQFISQAGHAEHDLEEPSEEILEESIEQFQEVIKEESSTDNYNHDSIVNAVQMSVS